MRLKQISFLLAVTFLLFTSLSVNSSTAFPTGNDYAIDAFPADNYADEIITSMSFFYDSGENALGAPDGLYANEYGNSNWVNTGSHVEGQFVRTIDIDENYGISSFKWTIPS